jgi:hypothetical protein
MVRCETPPSFLPHIVPHAVVERGKSGCVRVVPGRSVRRASLPAARWRPSDVEDRAAGGKACVGLGERRERAALCPFRARSGGDCRRRRKGTGWACARGLSASVVVHVPFWGGRRCQREQSLVSLSLFGSALRVTVRRLDAAVGTATRRTARLYTLLLPPFSSECCCCRCVGH